jgi:hypothetical protein
MHNPMIKTIITANIYDVNSLGRCLWTCSRGCDARSWGGGGACVAPAAEKSEVMEAVQLGADRNGCVQILQRSSAVELRVLTPQLNKYRIFVGLFPGITYQPYGDCCSCNRTPVVTCCPVPNDAFWVHSDCLGTAGYGSFHPVRLPIEILSFAFVCYMPTQSIELHKLTAQ